VALWGEGLTTVTNLRKPAAHAARTASLRAL